MTYLKDTKPMSKLKMITKMKWTSDADKLLARLWNEGETLSGVAKAMCEKGYNVNRNQISGRKNRLKLMGVLLVVREQSPQIRVKINGNVVVPLPTIRSASRLPVTEQELAMLARNPGVEYLALDNYRCKAILDSRGEYGLPKCCGLLQGLDYSGGPTVYCQTHFRLYTSPPRSGSAIPIKRGK